jgi:hypothetical protein
MDYTLDELEEAQVKLFNKTKQARGDLDYLTRELSRLIVGSALDAQPQIVDEINSTRQLIAGCNQTLEETPAALVILKEMVAEIRSQEAQEQRREQSRKAREAYIELRQEIIENPSLADYNEALGRLNALSNAAFGAHKNGEVRELTAAAREYNSRNRSEPFTFNVTIPE